MAMAMFNNGETFEIDKVAEYLKSNWNTTVSDIKGDSCALAFSINGETVVLASMPVQIPFDVIKGTVQYLYNWQTAEKDLEDHNSHVIVSVLSSNKKEIERFGILTKVLSSIIATTNCIGVYLGTQSLLIPREQCSRIKVEPNSA